MTPDPYKYLKTRGNSSWLIADIYKYFFAQKSSNGPIK